MNTVPTLSRGFIFAIALLSFPLWTPAAVDAARTIRIQPGVLRATVTNRVSVPVTAAITNQTLRIKMPPNTTLLTRRGNDFVSVNPVGREGTNQVYELQPSDVYVARGTPSV